MAKPKTPDTNPAPKDAPKTKEDKKVKPVDRWKGEIEKALKGRHDFTTRGNKIVDRYRDERKSEERQQRKFNLLWSNVQTLGPALYSRPPKVVVTRRFNDSDKVGRIASLILERGVEYELEKYDIGACMKPAVQDRLLPGQGAAWVRYEPHMQTVQPTFALKGAQDFVGKQGFMVSDDAEYYDGEGNAYAGKVEQRDGVPTGFGEQHQEKEWECTPTDYVFWQDFLTSPARTWEEVRWVARRTNPSRAQLVKRFGEEIGNQIPLTAKPKGYEEKDPVGSELSRGEVWEIWDREAECVYWVATGFPELCDERPDPLEIEGFFPCPKPILATTTTDTLIPVADFAEYQDQALEIDDLTERIAKLTEAVKVVGLYDKSNAELQRLLNNGVENRMIAVDNWAAFAEKGGISGQVSFLPLKEVIEALQALYQARQQVLNDVYQITGMADIVRGASNPNETATAQQIKGKYANLRLSDLQMDVERFARDLIRIKAEIMAEQYSAETLITISGIMQIPEFTNPPAELTQQPEVPPPQPGEDPAMAQQAQQQAQAQQQQALLQWQQENQKIVQDAIALLKSPQMRDLRIDIETQSMVQMDEDADKQSRTEFLAAVGGFIQQAGTLMQTVPQAGPMLGEFLRFAVRGFRVGRELESTIDRFVESMGGGQGGGGDPKQAEQQQAQQQQAMKEQAQVAQDKLAVQKDSEMIPLKQKNAEQAIEIKGLRVMGEIKDLVQGHADHVRGLVDGAKQKPETLPQVTKEVDASGNALLANISQIVAQAQQPPPQAPPQPGMQ